MTDVAPHDVEAEDSGLGAVLLTREAAEYAVSHLEVSDFYQPAHQHIFSAVRSLHDNGSVIDTITVTNELKRVGVIDAVGGQAALVALSYNTVPSVAYISHYAEIIQRDASGRRQINIAREAIDSIQHGKNPYDVADSVVTQIQSLGRGNALPKGFTTFGVILDDEDADAPVIIPGVCYADSRVIVVATEKSGKSVFLRMIAFCASQGVHPFTYEPIDPVRVMVWDLENPMRELRKTGHLLRHRLRNLVDDYDETRLMIMRRPAGVDLDSRHDRDEFESAIESFKPQLIIGGPVYKMLPEGKIHDDRHAACLPATSCKL